jgi:hypothetical protein
MLAASQIDALIDCPIAVGGGSPQRVDSALSLTTVGKTLPYGI